MHRSNYSVSDSGRLTLSGGFIPASIVALVVLTLGLGGNNRANAAGITINTPAGLVPGDTLRIAFVTDASTQATSTDINYYNNFVNADATAEAGGGSITYNGTPLTFSAIGSTQAVNAITNIGQTGAPVYLTNGTEVARSDTASVGGLWSGSLIHPISLDLINELPHSQVWTGTNTIGISDFPLGTQIPIVGYSDISNSGWIYESHQNPPVLDPLYGISQPLSVVPEPASIVLCLSAAGCGAVGAYVRRRRADRRVR